MRIVAELERALAAEESPFRAQLLREDLARLRKLQQLVRSSADGDAFKKAGARIGWTQGDARTAELREPLERFLAEVYDLEKGAGDDARVVAAWNELHRARMERLLGCLSTPVPKPAE
jgi:hypothetical protein